VRQVLIDPRKIPYLFVWKSAGDGEVKEAVHVTHFGPSPFYPPGEYVHIGRTGDYSVELRTVWKALPRNGGRELLLVCPGCEIPKRYLYCWEVDLSGQYKTSVKRGRWQCRTCAGLRYASEGAALVLRSRWTFARLIEQQFGRCRSPRPEPWYPQVFSSIRG